MATYLLALLLISSAQIGTEKSTGWDCALDWASFKNSATSIRIEFYLQLSYATLLFERLDSSFIGRYQVSAEIRDKQNVPIAGKIWQKEIVVADYEDSQQTSNWAINQFNLNLNIGKEKKFAGMLRVEDLNSLQKKEFDIVLEVPNQLSDIRLKKSGKANPTRSYSVTDTSELEWEVYSYNPLSTDTCTVTFWRDRKILNSWVSLPSGVKKTTGIWVKEYKAQLAFADLPDLENGSYFFRIIYNPTQEQKNVKITIANPFYLSIKTFLEKVEELCYIATEEEMRELRNALPSERQRLWNEFWRKKDPTPTTEENEVMDDYFKRIEYCKEHFGRGDKGYKSDRARVYMKFGAPDLIESNPFERSSQPYEIWYYYNPNLRFVFVDVSGFGEYILTSGQGLLR